MLLILVGKSTICSNLKFMLISRNVSLVSTESEYTLLSCGFVVLVSHLISGKLQSPARILFAFVAIKFSKFCNSNRLLVMWLVITANIYIFMTTYLYLFPNDLTFRGQFFLFRV